MSDKELNNSCGYRLRTILEENNMTQFELAERTGFTPQYINNIVNGRKSMTISAAARFSDVLGISSKFLLCESDYYYYQKHIDEMNDEEYGVQASSLESCIGFILQSLDIHYHGFILEMPDGKKTYYHINDGEIPTVILNDQDFKEIREAVKVFAIVLICEKRYEIPMDEYRVFVKDIFEYIEFKSQKFAQHYTNDTPNILLPKWLK